MTQRKNVKSGWIAQTRVASAGQVVNFQVGYIKLYLTKKKKKTL